MLTFPINSRQDQPKSLWRLRQKVAFVAMVPLFAAVATVLLLQSHAATPTAAVEPESGQLAGNVNKIADTTASGSAAVLFGGGQSTGTVLFEDDFNGAAGSMADQTKWGEYSACGYNPSAAYGDIQCGQDETLDGQGHLIIPATASRGQSLMTGDKFRFEYGTASAWIKMPSQAGYWPAFWTLNNYASGNSANQVGEIDVNENYTTWQWGYHAGLHNWDAVDSNASVSGGPDLVDFRQTNPSLDLSAGYHKYSVKVEPGQVTFYFDDQEVGHSYQSDNPTKDWNFGPTLTRGNFLILTLAVGGAGQAAPTANAQMLVDKVLVTSN